MTVVPASEFEFSLPPELEAGEPPEARGLRRDQVRLMVSNYSNDRIRHARFDELLNFLNKGDVLVINTSRTRNSALTALRADGTPLELHLSTQLMEDLMDRRTPLRTTRWQEQAFRRRPARRGLKATRRGHGPITRSLYQRLRPGSTTAVPDIVVAALNLPTTVDDYLARFGFPIRYNYVKEKWPLSYYQTVYATESGSAEMPSAGRPFTPELLSRLESKGIQIAPLILHTGISNLETHEPPYKEFYQVPSKTARLVNERSRFRPPCDRRRNDSRANARDRYRGGGKVHAGEGWTCKVITPHYKLRSVNALLTGMHEPQATHLAILQSLAGLAHTKLAYIEALSHGYLWHEFGDLHLIMQ